MANQKLGIRCLLLASIIWFLCVGHGKSSVKEDTNFDDDILDSDEVKIEDVDPQENEPDIQYQTPTPSGPVYFAEHFDDPDISRKRWLISRAQKEEQNNVFKYDGEWDFQLPQNVLFSGDRALVLKSKAKHAAIAAKLDKKFDFNTKPLFVQYEVNFQNGIDCGGAYIKLLSDSPNSQLETFHDKTPYSIMFGPDKCGNDYKLHFIFRHKNPINGTFEEKHAKRPSNRHEENYSDKKSHLYLLKLYPDNTFQVLVDGKLSNSGSLLEDMTPPVNPPLEVEDVNDRKPSNWDERETVPDEKATKPEDWDEDAPPKIPDTNAVKPSGWLDEEIPMLPDASAIKPDDWDDTMDGEWEPPLLTNKACENAPGCGPWSPPLIDNPNFKGKWKAPMISNPNYQGKWSPKMIPNPNYFDDKEPFKMASIGAVGIEIWAMTDLILFDNFIITDNENVLEDWTTATYELKRQVINKDAESVFSRLLGYTNKHPWLYAVYLVVIGLPIVVSLSFFCGGTQEKKLESGHHKKTDDIAEDDDFPTTKGEGDQSNAKWSKNLAEKEDSATSKEDLEGDKDDSDDEDEEEEEEDDESGGHSGAEEDQDQDDRDSPKSEENESFIGGDGDVPRKRRPRLE